MELRSQAEALLSLFCLFSLLASVENWAIVFYVVSGEVFVEHHALIIMDGPWLDPFEGKCRFSFFSEQWMLKGFFPADSIRFIDRKTLRDEIPRKVRNQLAVSNLLCVDGANKLQLVACHPWCFSMQHLIKDKPNWPQIWLICVLLFLQQLRRHVERSSYDWLQEGILTLNALREAKIANLALTALQKNISRFEVAMDDVIGAEILDPTQYLPKEVHSLMLTQLPFFLEIMIKIIIA
jgi:hypothetical protein